jgi:DNA-binding CsgD family transcriptional regulator/tetratricopeptide (TPR) repeat protein
VAGQAVAGLQTATGEAAAARWLDAEAPMMRQVLPWAMQHDPLAALRLAVALAPWWQLRGQLAGHYALLREAAGHAGPGGDTWCAAQFWLSAAAFFAGDRVTALGHLTTVRDAIEDRGPSRALAGCLGGQSLVLAKLGRTAEAAHDGRRALALAREIGDRAVEALVLNFLTLIALDETGDPDGALRLARQAQQVTADIPGWIARVSANMLTAALIEAGDLAAAERSCAAWLSPARDADDRVSLARLLIRMAALGLRSGRTKDAASHLREAVQIATPIGQAVLLACLDCCGYLCAATGRAAEAITLWAAYEALARHEGFTDSSLEVRSRNEPLARARHALGPARTRAAEDRGAAMRLATAAEYALMLTDPSPRQPAATEPGKLSARERELVTLVAQGRTNAQIAGQLYISVRTVSSHLDRIRDKTGCRRRADLTRLALTIDLV